jgi:hypothetical protein
MGSDARGDLLNQMGCCRCEGMEGDSKLLERRDDLWMLCVQ